MTENGLSSGEKLLICLLVPFYPIILPFSFHIIIIVKTGQKEILEKEEETIIEVVMMVSKKERIMKLKIHEDNIIKK